MYVQRTGRAPSWRDVPQSLYPRKRPFAALPRNVAMGHKATYAVQQEDINKSCLDVLNR